MASLWKGQFITVLTQLNPFLEMKRFTFKVIAKSNGKNSSLLSSMNIKQ